MSGNAEEFWNNSSQNAFNFDDDYEQERFSSVTPDTFNTFNESLFLSPLENESLVSTLPLHSVLTKSSLEAILDDIHVPQSTSSISPQETVSKMFLNMPFFLGMFKTLDQKLALLDEAVLTGDGNIITAVLLYIKRSLKLSIFYHHLAKRKIALQHYVNYLMMELNLEELAHLYMYNRNCVDIVYLFYLQCKDVTNTDRTLYKLTKFLNEYKHNLDGDNKLIFSDFEKFLGWQVENHFTCSSVTEQLKQLCQNEWNANKDKKISEFKQFLKLNDFQYEWIVLNTVCALQMWPKLIGIFIKPNWLSKKNSFKSVINVELFLSTLCSHNPPRSVVAEFLGCMPVNEDALKMAQKMNCYKFVIDFYISQRDRQSIIHYKECIPYGSEDYVYAENVLAAVDKKWKN